VALKITNMGGYLLRLIIPAIFLIVAGVLTGVTAEILSVPVKFT